MKNNKIYSGFILIIILITVFPNCKNRESTDNVIKKEPFILKGQKYELSETFSAINLKIVDSMLIFLCSGDPYKFHVYNKNTLEFIGKFGQEGRGPSEYMLPIIVSQQQPCDKDSIYIVIYDDVLRRISFINILQALNNTNYNPKSINSRNKMISQVSLVASAVISDENLIVGSSTDGLNVEGRFFCYDIEKDILTWMPFYPQPINPPHKLMKGAMYKSYLAIRPNNKDIAAVALFFERIDILNNKGKLKHSIIFENQDIQDFSDNSSLPPKKSHEYFTSVSVSQDFIYALNIDLAMDSHQILDTAIVIKATWDEFSPPPSVYKITPQVIKIEVDEDNNRIIGLKPFNSFIYIYDIENNYD